MATKALQALPASNWDAAMMLMIQPATTDSIVKLPFALSMKGNYLSLTFPPNKNTISLCKCKQAYIFLAPACSLDGHFVFSVKATDTDPPIDPSSLIVKDQPHCFPVVTTPDEAVFKISVMDCGAKMKVMLLRYLVLLIISLKCSCIWLEYQ